MNEEIDDVLEKLGYKAGVYLNQNARNEVFNDDDYYCYVLLNYIVEKDKEIERLNKENEELKKIQCTFLGTGCKAEIERLNNIINGTDEILKEHINECREELNTIMKGNDSDYINECSREFDVIRKNIEMIIEKIEELKGSDKE